MIKKLKIAWGCLLVFWLVAIILTFNNTWYWYAYLIISASAFLLAGILLYHSNLKDLYQQTRFKQQNIQTETKKNISHQDDDDEYYELNTKRSRQKKKRRRKKRYQLMETGNRERKKTNQPSASNKTLHKASSIRNKEYLHTKIPLLYNGEKQALLFNTIQQLKEQDFFTSYYAGVTNEDLMTHFNEYQERNIFELYDNTIPNTFAKVLYDPESVSNRIGIFLGQQPSDASDNEESNLSNEDMLGFIDIKDSYKADLLLEKYNNIQVFPTILGGTYKRAYKNEEGSIKIIKDFINYDLTISLAFYNN